MQIDRQIKVNFYPLVTDYPLVTGYPLFSSLITLVVMGFDINVVTFENGYVEFKTSLYMSYNWSDLKDIWYVRRDVHDLHALKVRENLERALKILDDRGVKTKVFTSEENSSWGWGINMSPDDRMGVFRYHLERFLVATYNNPTSYFLDEETEKLYVDGIILYR